MAFNFVFLQGIDFTNKENILFLFIFSIIAVIIISVFILILRKIIKAVKRIIVRLFNIDVRKPKFDKKSTNWLHQSQANKSAINLSAPKVVVGDITKNPTAPIKVTEAVKNQNVNIANEVGEKTGYSNPLSHLDEKDSAKLPIYKNEEPIRNDQSIFDGKTEVSRIKLEHELRTDADVWKAAKAVGLTMSPVERSKLVKQVFSSAYGRNISKTDLKSGIKKLNQKMLSAKDSTEHEKIRKEMKFFKKIGGIKG